MTPRHRRLFVCVSLLCVLALPSVALAQQPIDADVLLIGGTLYDGTGADGVVGDLAINDGKIVAMGKFPRGTIGQTIDCQGLIICPGFIDLHNHSDRPILDSRTRANTNFLTQGCTTIVTGNCGGGHVDVAEYFKEVEFRRRGHKHHSPAAARRPALAGHRQRSPPTFGGRAAEDA